MEYFTEQAYTHREVLDKIKIKYGDRAKILTHRTVRTGGFLGFFTHEGVEMSGYISNETLNNHKHKLQEEKQKILEGVKGDKTLLKVLEEVQFIKEKMTHEYEPKHEKNHQAIECIEQILSENEFTVSYIRWIIDRLKKELSWDELDNSQMVHNTVLNWIGESIPLYSHEEQAKKNKQRTVILVGPTGVGKTTTIAKLAAIHSFGSKGEKQKNVRIITIDNYRIGAKKQIETYGEIMGIPVACVESYEDLEKKIALYRDADLILVDTIGKSPRDYTRLAEMRELLDACGNSTEVFIAISSTTKISDLKEILQQFEPFKYTAVILTKLDETLRVGNIISVIWERRKPLIYYTDGQVVPQDIERASIKRLLKTLEGFSMERAQLEKIDAYASKVNSNSKSSDGLSNEEQLYLQGKKSGEWR